MTGREDDSVWGALARLDVAIATARAFAAQAGVERVALLVDQEGREAALVECAPDGEVVITEGDREYALPGFQAVAAAPLPLPEVRGLPYVEIDLEAATLAAPIGVIQHLVDAVRALAAQLPGRSVATADWPTSDPDTPLTIAARDGEPVVIAIGDAQFEL